MRLYFAAIMASVHHESALCLGGGIRYRLLSFADVERSKDVFRYWTGNEPPAPSFFMDSGAFTALAMGTTIDIGRYCDFIERNKEHLDPYAALDVIGDWKGSARNYDTMRERGLQPVPTFHLGSPIEELRRLLGETDHIALGGVGGARRLVMEPWLDICWREIRNSWPKKVHIFGNMSQWCLERYPWFSADSSTAVVGGGLGNVLVWKDATLTTIHYNDHGRENMDGSLMDNVSKTRAESGSAHMARRISNVGIQHILQRHVTDVWRRRGIVWEEEQER